MLEVWKNFFLTTSNLITICRQFKSISQQLVRASHIWHFVKSHLVVVRLVFSCFILNRWIHCLHCLLIALPRASFEGCFQFQLACFMPGKVFIIFLNDVCLNGRVCVVCGVCVCAYYLCVCLFVCTHVWHTRDAHGKLAWSQSVSMDKWLHKLILSRHKLCKFYAPYVPGCAVDCRYIHILQNTNLPSLPDVYGLLTSPYNCVCVCVCACTNRHLGTILCFNHISADTHGVGTSPVIKPSQSMFYLFLNTLI